MREQYLLRNWVHALVCFKEANGLHSDRHGKLLENGDYLDEQGQVIGNLYPYLFSRTEPSYRDAEPDHMAPELCAKLLIYPGDCHPDMVSRLLRVQAGRQEVKGECITNRLGQRREVTRSLWILSSEPYIRSEALRDHLQWILERLVPRAEALRQLQALDSMKMTLRSFYWTKRTLGDALMEPDHLGLMAKLGLECSFDAYSCNPAEFHEESGVVTPTMEDNPDCLKPFWNEILRPLSPQTSLVVASREGDTETVDRLIAAGVALDTPMGYAGYTALMVAARHGHLGVVEALLAAGADANKAPGGITALWLASSGKYHNVVACLVAHGAQ